MNGLLVAQTYIHFMGPVEWSYLNQVLCGRAEGYWRRLRSNYMQGRVLFDCKRIAVSAHKRLTVSQSATAREMGRGIKRNPKSHCVYHSDCFQRYQAKQASKQAQQEKTYKLHYSFGNKSPLSAMV